ncbi:hypothetical protein TVAG_287800 [Trichomonas vaginalis G3]|uniref:PFU domain-containing protein n=1 Tax=Trichomonas vaginalis (strain ATCC PRA-98 / G3) TaxID=412133 RepID=A2ER47_TRIV3|nr:phospholipase A2-activating protein family [Trichomonas vaginalis G3]EAY04866.1 hypothetical protein TVAG_287800 [Trichomonas vaginalis G3]KAI5495306.1 phospholipase A2-activating protein family [Trichomonas vaginalis G3]|eukprot:XP_001317089.1 hypothetical protein [Trichomonas vaginalis G3]
MDSVILSSFTNVSEKELRCIITIVYNEKEYLVCGERTGIIYIYEYSNPLKLIRKFKAHESTISCIIYTKQFSWTNSETLLSGSLDCSIKSWKMSEVLDLDKEIKESYIFQEHEANVCFLKQIDENSFISSSWDSTAKIWRYNNNTLTLCHEGFAIWAVDYSNLGLITCGADCTLRLWSYNGDMIWKIDGAHTQPIRYIKMVNENQFVTIGNDGLLKHWQFNQESLKLVKSLQVTDTYLYHLFYSEKDIIYLCGEDKCLYIIDFNQFKVTDCFPLMSIPWCSSILRNNDIAVVGEDKSITILTNDDKRRCSVEEEAKFFDNLKEIEFNLSEEMISLNDISDINDLANEEPKIGFFSLNKDKNGEIVISLFSKGYNKWIQCGKSKTKEKQKVTNEKGEKFDVCISIVIENIGFFKNLYFNVDQDPENVVDQFLSENKLPEKYKNEILEFVKANVNPKLLKQRFFPKMQLFKEETQEISKLIENFENEQQKLINKCDNDMLHNINLIVSNCAPELTSFAIEILRFHISQKESKDLDKKLISNIVTSYSARELTKQGLISLLSLILDLFSICPEITIDLWHVLEPIVQNFTNLDGFSQKLVSKIIFNSSVVISKFEQFSQHWVNLMNIVLSVCKYNFEVSEILLFSFGNFFYFSSNAVKSNVNVDLITDIALESVENDELREAIFDILSTFS